MNLNFSSKRFYGPEAGEGAASGSTPWGAIAQGAIGLGQFIAGAIQRRKGEKAAEAQIGKLGPDQGILGYYNQALSRYGVSPTESAMYKRQMQNIQRAGATGLAGAQGSRARMGAASSIARSLSDATLGAEVAAEQEKSRRFGVLGGASQMAAAEKRRPEELRLQMALQKAAGGSQIANVGMSNIFGGIQSAATEKLYRDMYGVGGKGKGITTPGTLPLTQRYGAIGPTEDTALPVSSTYGAGILARPQGVPYLPSYLQQGLLPYLVGKK